MLRKFKHQGFLWPLQHPGFLWLILGSALAYQIYNISDIIETNVSCDIGWLVYAANGLNHGKILYKDLFEINPPLIFSLHYLTNYVADFINYPQTKAYHAFVLIFITLLFALSLKVIQPELTTIANKITLIFGLSIYTFYLPLNIAVYGEREHLFLMLYTPYILSVYMWVRYKKKVPFDRLITGLAIFGFMLKPFYLVFFIAGEACLFSSWRKTINERKSYYIIFGSLMFIYLILIYLITPYYFSDVLPIGMKTYYGHRFSDRYIISEIIKNFTPLPFILLLIAFSDKYLLRGHRRLCLGLLFASVLMPIIQFKGWPYTYFPLFAFSYLIMLMIVSEMKLYSELSAMVRKLFRKPLKLDLPTIYTCLFFTIAMTTLMLEYYDRLDSQTIFLQPFTLYFIVFMAVLLMKHQSFKSKFSILIASISLLPFALIFFEGTIFTLFFVGSPLLYLITIIIFAGGIFYGRRFKLNNYSRNYIILVIVACLGVFYCCKIQSNFRRMNYRVENDPLYRALEKPIKDTQTKNIFIFNTTLFPAFPLVNYSGVGWSSRFHHLWMLPAIYANANQANKCLIEKNLVTEAVWTYNAVYEDLQAVPPELLMFDVSPQIFLKREDLNFNWHKCIKEGYAPLDNFIQDNYHFYRKVSLCKRGQKTNCAFEIYRLNDNKTIAKEWVNPDL